VVPILALIVILAGLLVPPAGAVLSMAPIISFVRIGDVVTLSGTNTENSTTFLSMTGPYLGENGVMLTNTSRTASEGYFDSVAVFTNYSWSFDWNTSLPSVSLNEGIYVIYAAAVPLPRNRLTGRTYATQMISFRGTVLPVTTETPATPTPVPTWTQPPAGAEVQVSSASSDDYPGKFDGDLLVYEADRGDGNSDIYLYNITSGNTTPVATGPAIQHSPAISGGKVVYSAYEVHQFNKTDTDLFIYDVASGATRQLTLPGDQLNPRISGDLLAWQDEPPGRSSVNVVLYDLQTMVKLKVPARTWAYSPDLSGGKVIWTDDPTGPAIFLYDISEGTVRRVTNRTGIKGSPAIDGHRITWADTRTDYAEIYVLDLDTGAETQVTTDDSNHFTPAISGNLVAWVDFRSGNRDIYLYDLAAGREIAVTTNEENQVSPQIGGCSVAWADDRNGSYDVYYKRIPGCTPSPRPAPVSLQPEATATPAPETTPPIPTVMPSTTASTPTSTAVSTTKSPGFGMLPALAALTLLVMAIQRRRVW
jgi:beta propeller repeat protein